MRRKLLVGGLMALAATTAPLGRSSWACEPPPNPPPLVVFEGVVLSSPSALTGRWTFRVDPPVQGLPEIVEVAIERSDAGDGASCRVAGPELIVGATYEIVGGRWPGTEHLNVSLYVGSYRLLSEPSAVSEAPSGGPSELPVADAVESNAGSSGGGSVWALVLFAAIGGVVVAVAWVAFARSRPD